MYVQRMWARRRRPPGQGTQIWPPCRWPARTRSKAPGGSRSTMSGKWQRRIRRSASGSARSARARPTVPVRARVDADDLDLSPAQLERPRVVDSRVAGSRSRQLGRMRERVAGLGEVVVAEDGVAAGQPGEQPAQPLLARAAREQVAADQRQVRLPLLDPVDGALDRRRPARRKAEMEVGEVRDPQAVELCREPGQRTADASPAAPSRPRSAPTRGRPPPRRRRAGWTAQVRPRAST